jgi:hypothetical protein
MHTGFQSKNFKERDHLRDLDRDERMIVKLISQKQSERMWTGFNWLMIGSNGGLL